MEIVNYPYRSDPGEGVGGPNDPLSDVQITGANNTPFGIDVTGQRIDPFAQLDAMDDIASLGDLLGQDFGSDLGLGANVTYGGIGGINDSVSPNQAGKAQITKEKYDSGRDEINEIIKSDKSPAQITAEISAVLTDLGIPHDPNTLNYNAGSDAFGLLSHRIDIIEDTPSSGNVVIGQNIPGQSQSGGVLPSDVQIVSGGGSQLPTNTNNTTPTNTGGGTPTNTTETGQTGIDANQDRVFTYNADRNVFIHSDGTEYPAGDTHSVDLKDGGVYSVLVFNDERGASAEHVVDSDGNTVAKVDYKDGVPILVSVGGLIADGSANVGSPAVAPAVAPSVAPSVQPAVAPAVTPTVVPAVAPSVQPAVAPSVAPSVQPSVAPSVAPVSPAVVPAVEPVQPAVAPVQGTVIGTGTVQGGSGTQPQQAQNFISRPIIQTPITDKIFASEYASIRLEPTKLLRRSIESRRDRDRRTFV